MKTRTLTLLVDVEQPDADWIWESHVDGKYLNGAHVRVIMEGDCTDPEGIFRDKDDEE